MEATAKRFRKREAILSCVRNTDTHPGAEWVFEQLKPEIPDLSLGTVYRNLSLFKDQGLIISIGHVAGVERFDGNTAPHVHFICQRCARVTDLMALEIPQHLTSQAEDACGGQVETCCLSFTGTCSACKQKNQV